MYFLIILFCTGLSSTLVATEKNLTEQQKEIFVFDATKIAKKISSLTYDQNQIILSLTHVPNDKKTKEFVDTLKTIMTGITYSQDALIKKLGAIDPKHYTEPFANLVLALSPGQKSGSYRLRMIEALAPLSPDTYTNPKFVDTLKTIMTGIIDSQDALIKKLGSIDPKHYTEPFANLVLALSPGEKLGSNRAPIIEAFENANIENFKRLLEWLKNHEIADYFVGSFLDICVQFSNNLENINQLNHFLKTIEDNQKQGAAHVFMEYHSNPNLIEKAQNLFTKLKTVSFQEPIDMHLLEQIVGINGASSNRLGRHDESLPLAKEIDAENYLMDHQDTFSQNPNLGDDIKDYFQNINRPSDGLYQYAIGGNVPIEQSKGIIIDNYGGYGGIGFNASASVREKQLIRRGYTVINLQTRDNWQTQFQLDQFQTPAGQELLGDTLIQFFLFAKAIKKQYPTKQLFFSSGSFGGTKGALINLILSNKDTLGRLFTEEFKDLADRLTLFFKDHPDITSDLIKGYILHDGAYHYFWSKGYVIDTYFISNPMLLLQNFDDERVTTDHILGFYKKLKKDKTADTNLFIHITPQGASTVLQKADDGHYTSAEGHFKPEVEKYRTEYNQKVYEFLRHAHGDFNAVKKDSYREGINQMRVRHASTLWNANNTNFTILYRLYYANLHNEKSSDTVKMIDRLSKTCAQYAVYLATKDSTKTQAQYYEETVNRCGLWLIAKILDKNAKTIKAVEKFITKNKAQANQLIDELRSSPKQEAQPSERPNSPVNNTHQIEYRTFVVTEEARSYLKTKPDALKLLEMAKNYGAIITKDLLTFIEKKDPVLSKEDLKELWKMKSLPNNDDLEIMSRSLSLIATQPQIKEEERETVLESVLEWNPIDILRSFDKKNLDAQTIKDLMRILLSIEESKRLSLLSDIKNFLPSPDAIPIMTWLTTIPDEIRADVIKNYQRAVTIIFKKNIDKKNGLAAFLRSIDFEVLQNLKLDNQLFGFIKDMNEMSALDQSKWKDFFNRKYGHVGRFLDSQQIKEHIKKTSGKALENITTDTINLEQILLTISNNTNSPQKLTFNILWQDKFGKGRTSLDKSSSVLIMPNETRNIKRKELRDEFNGKTAIADKLKFISFDLANKNCSIEDKIGTHLSIVLSDNGNCAFEAVN